MNYITFKSLLIGDKFECYGDQFINYDFPKLCICIKTGIDSAQELDGVNFFLSESDEVFVYEEKVIPPKCDECCCNCVNQLKIMCHPTNGEKKEFGWLEDRFKFGKGPINKQLGWGCKVIKFDDSSKVVFFDREHGMCEMFYRK